MKRESRVLLLVFLFIITASNSVLAFIYQNPDGLYTTSIPEQWVYQSHLSTDQLTVFYGADNLDILYFEQVGNVPDATTLAWAERSIELYQQPGGLKNFSWDNSFEEIIVGLEEAISCLYSYQDTYGNKLWEQRIFIILPNQTGFSITLGGAGEASLEPNLILASIIDQWRWSWCE